MNNIKYLFLFQLHHPVSQVKCLSSPLNQTWEALLYFIIPDCRSWYVVSGYAYQLSQQQYQLSHTCDLGDLGNLIRNLVPSSCLPFHLPTCMQRSCILFALASISPLSPMPSWSYIPFSRGCIANSHLQRDVCCNFDYKVWTFPFR